MSGKKSNKANKAAKKVKFVNEYKIFNVKKNRIKSRKFNDTAPRFMSKIKGPYSKLYNMNKNTYCANSKTINNCLNKIRLKPWTMKYVGGGTYGSIFSISDYSDKEFAIKMIVYVDTLKNKNNQLKVVEEIETEINYAIAMSHNGLGPKIYGAFYIIDEKEELPKNHPWAQKLINVVKKKNEDMSFIKEMEKRNCVLNIQFLLMEKYDMDCHDALKSDNLTVMDKQQIVKKMVLLLYQQVYLLEIYCYDIRPGNFLVNEDNLETRMIDFGIDYCKQETIFEKDPKFSFSTKQKLQEAVVINNILQLYLLTYKIIKDYNDEDFAAVTMYFFDNHIMKLFFKGPWKNLIVDYVDHCYKYMDTMKAYDAPMLLVGYFMNYFSYNKEIFKKGRVYIIDKITSAIQRGLDSFMTQSS